MLGTSPESPLGPGPGHNYIIYVARSHMAEKQFSLVVYTSSVPCFL